MEDLRIATIGAGRLSSRRIYPLLHRLGVQLVAVCDLDAGRAASTAATFGAGATYTDHRAMIADEELDAVIVCVGPGQHAALAVDVMQAGLPVYTEKPPATSAAEARRVLEVSRTSGQICMTAFKKRFAPAYEKVRKAIASGSMGQPSLLTIQYCSGPTYSNEGPDPTAHFLLDFCPHILDLSRYLLGEVAEVYAMRRGRDTYAVTVRFHNGAVGVLGLSSNRDWGVPNELVEVTGEPGRFASVTGSVEMVRYEGARIVDSHRPNFSTAGGDSLIETGFAGELHEFVSAVAEQRKPESSIASSYRTMVLYEAVRDSCETSRPISIDLHDDDEVA